MSSQITHAHSSNIHPLANILGTCALISIVAYFLQFTSTAACDGISPLSMCQRYYHSTGGRSEITQKKQVKNAALYIIWSTYAPPGLSTPFYLFHIVAQSPISSLCNPEPPRLYIHIYIYVYITNLKLLKMVLCNIKNVTLQITEASSNRHTSKIHSCFLHCKNFHLSITDAWERCSFQLYFYITRTNFRL